MTDLMISTTRPIAVVAFDRAKVLNALSPDMLADLIETCRKIADDESIQVVQLQGSGGCFSAGADLPAFLQRLSGENAREVADLGRQATEAIAELPQITVAAIQRHCVGGGLVLAAACDIRIAADDARFLIPELDAGIPLAWGGMSRLIRLVGETMAADAVLSCRPFGADEALRVGLISRVVPADRFDEEMAGLTESIAGKPASVLRATKRQLLDIRGGRFDARNDADALLAALGDPEAQKQGMAYLKDRLQQH